MSARVAAEPLDVPRLAPARLTVLAVAHHERRVAERAPESGEPAERTGASGILDRWKVDYLRHRLSRYDDILADLRDSAGRAAAEEVLRRRVYAAIAEAYPELARECERQLRDLHGRGGTRGVTGAKYSDARAGASTHDRRVDRREPPGPQEPP